MRPLEFLREELGNVERALQETLRHDYGPELSDEFYSECGLRLERIKDRAAPSRLVESDHTSIARLLGELAYVSNLISLIERSRLGEFSWPFADELRDLAKTLLEEEDLFGQKTHPIIHVVADGRGYRIWTEDVIQAAISSRRFAIVLFPRPHKDHVLLHAIFGHELGHAALGSTEVGAMLGSQVYPALTAGLMSSEETATAWLNRDDAPDEVKADLAEYEARHKKPFRLKDEIRNWWLQEFVCDLCGLLLFGPAFLAAHKAIIQPAHPSPLKFDLLEPTHPPYGARHKVLLRAMRFLQWQKTITLAADKEFHNAENTFLADLVADPFPSWAQLFSEEDLENAVVGIQSVLRDVQYAPPNASELVGLVSRLKNSLPPICDGLHADGTVQLVEIDFRKILHAGWVFWAGRSHLSPPSDLPFLKTNRLCNQALLQQRAINEYIKS